MAKFSDSPELPCSSLNRKRVFLHEWWLIQVEGDSKLGVGGYSTAERVGAALCSATTAKRHKNRFQDDKMIGVRVFSSAEIAKRHDKNTLETVDGITVMISGCINCSRTQQNGFSTEVCYHFRSGFPFNWEEYADKASHDKRAGKTKRSLLESLDDLPITEVRDLLMSTTGESEACALTSIVFSDLMKQCGGDSLTHSTSSVNSDEELLEMSEKTESERKSGGSFSDATEKITKVSTPTSTSTPVRNPEETESERRSGGSFSDATGKITEASTPTSTSTPVRNPEVGVSALIRDVLNSFRRSRKKMTKEAQEVSQSPRRTGAKHEQEESGSLSHATEKIIKDAQELNLSKLELDVPSLFEGASNLTRTCQKSPVKLFDPFPTPVDSEDPSQGKHTRRIASDESNTAIISGEKRKATESQGESSLRRSARLNKKI